MFIPTIAGINCTVGHGQTACRHFLLQLAQHPYLLDKLWRCSFKQASVFYLLQTGFMAAAGLQRVVYLLLGDGHVT